MSSLPFLKKSGQATFKDREVTKASELIQEWSGEEQIKGVGLLGAPLSTPSISLSGASMSPATVRKALQAYSTYAIEEDIDIGGSELWDLGDILMHPTSIQQSHQRIEETVRSVLSHHPEMIPIILGGDHSISFPSVQGFTKEKGRVGIIQFDAHHDLRNLEDGGPTNGTPFRGLIESGSIKGEDLIQIGIRNFSNAKGYATYAKEQGVTVYTMRDVRENAIQEIIATSVKQLENKVDAIYISVDVDVLDQTFAPGCPAIGPGGMDSTTLLDAIYLLAQHKSVKGMDIVEIDPTKDFRDMTSRVGAHIILQFLLGRLKLLGH